MDILKLIKKNLKKNSSSNVMKRIGWVLVGGVLYPVVPTAIQGWFKVDMSGWKGMFTGAIAAGLIGAASDKMEIAAGGIGAAMTHATYIHGQASAQQLLNSPFFAFDPSVQLMDEDLPEGYERITLPDGNEIVANVDAGPGQPTEAALDDYVENVPAAAQLNYAERPPAAALGDRVQMPPGVGLGDRMDRVPGLPEEYAVHFNAA